MNIGNNRLALYAPLQDAVTAPASSSSPGLFQAAPGMAGWWDASSASGLLGLGNTGVDLWTEPGSALIDLSGNGQNLVPFSTVSHSSLPVGSPHLSGLLGGAGYPVGTTNLLQPALDPDAGWQHPGPGPDATASWTWYLVWSRPNWRQGSSQDESPITLLTIGGKPILQVDSRGGNGRLTLCPGIGQVVVSSLMSRRHTHSAIIRYSPASGMDFWLDDIQGAASVPWIASGHVNPTILLHDGTVSGAAQCWLHEAAKWTERLSDVEVTAVNGYSERWVRGARKGLYFLINGQSNAINYSLNDGAASMLVRGVAWHLGALAYNVLATTGISENYTMQSGHGIYAVPGTGYTGSFVTDPGDGTNSSGWALGSDGLAVQTAVSNLSVEDAADLCAIIWPWSETDSLRQYNESSTFEGAALRLLSLLRGMLGDNGNKIPLVWWNAIPYGGPPGIAMHRQVVQDVASNVANNVIIGNPQTSDSNARGSLWNAATGIATGGDASHRDSGDNVRFAMLASPVVARALMSKGHTDSIKSIPDAIFKVGGPSIGHVYRQSSTMLIVSVIHDCGNDLRIPLQASLGAGFSVMDGGSVNNPGSIVPAVSCQRLDATHFSISLQHALQQPSAACRLFYPYGPAEIGRGNAVTDNYSALNMPPDWHVGRDLGSNWLIDCPLAATTAGIAVSDTA